MKKSAKKYKLGGDPDNKVPGPIVLPPLPKGMISDDNEYPEPPSNNTVNPYAVPSWFFNKATQDKNGIITGRNPDVVTINDTRSLGYNDDGTKQQNVNSGKGFQLASGILRGINFGTGALADFVNEGKNMKQERAKYLTTLQRLQDPNFVQNDVPIYTKFGGGVPREKALQILRDGKVQGHPLSPKQKKFFAAMAFAKAQDGADIEQVTGLPKHQAKYATIEAEAGEIYKQPNGDIKKISDNADRHEEGGELINNVEKVLEDTSTTRRDKKSKSLAVTPDDMINMFGIQTDKNLSHSEAMELAAEELNKKTSKISSKLKKILETVGESPNNKYAQNSLEFTVKELSKYPSKQDLFDSLFEHQESLKDNSNMGQAKYGIEMPKAQYGKLEDLYAKAKSPKATKADIKAFQMAFHEDPRTQSYADNLIKQRPTITNYGKQKGFAKTDLRQNEDGLLGDTTKQYFNYFEKNVAAQPQEPTDNGYDGRQGTEADYTDNTPVVQGNSDVTVTSTTKQPVQPLQSFSRTQSSQFNEPLSWTDILAPAASYLSADRIPANYNPAEFHKITPRLENVLPYLEQGQRDFNTVTGMQDSNSGAGSANNVNAFAQKYSIDNQIRAGVNDRNLQRQAGADMYNAQVADKQSVNDQQARATFESQQLAGMEAQRQQKLRALDEMMTRISLNRKQNREGNLLMKLFPNFDSYGNYNGNQRYLPLVISNNANGAVSATSPSRMQSIAVQMPNGKTSIFTIDMLDPKQRPISNNKDMTNTRQPATKYSVGK